MNEIITLVANKTGISAEKARTAVDTVLGFLKTKLPGPLASQIEATLGESGEGGNQAADAVKNLKGLLG
jgi:uncharacterized protein (DUF2267 family)